MAAWTLRYKAARYTKRACLSSWFTSISPTLSPPSAAFCTCPGSVRRLCTATAAQRPVREAPRPRRVGFLSLWPNFRSRIVQSRSRKLMAIMQLRRWDEALEHELIHSGVSLAPRIVDEVIACIPSSRLALQFYIWAGEQIGYPAITSRTTCDIVQWYADRSKLIPFLIALKGIGSPHFDLTPARVNVLIQGYGWAGMLERAFGVMLHTESFTNDILVKCLFHAIMKQYRYDMVLDIYTQLKQHKTPVSLFYNELIQGMALGDCQKWDEADQLYKEAADSGHVLENKTHNSLIWAMSRAGQHERACLLLADILKKNITLNNDTAVAVIESLCQAKELQRAARILEEVKKHGVVVPNNVYDRILRASKAEDSLEK